MVGAGDRRKPDGASGGSAPFWKDQGWRRRVGRTSLALWSASIVSFVGTVVAARSLGPARYGAVVLALSVATLVATFLDLTLEEAVIHHGARQIAEGAIGRLRSLLRTALVVDLGIGIVVALAIAALAGPVASLVSQDGLDPTLLRIAALTILAATANGTSGAVLQLAGRADLQAAASLLTNAVRLALVWAAAVAVGTPATVLGAYAIGTAVGAAAQGLLAWRIARRRWTADPEPGGSGWLRDLLPFGVHSSLATSAAAAHNALIAIVVGRLAGAASVGILDVALLPVALADLVSAPLRITVLPEQARLSAEGDVPQLRRSVRAHTLLGLGVGLPGAAAGWFLLPWLIPLLYSDRFRPAVTPARILLVMAVVSLALGWSKTLPGAIGRPQIRTAITLLAVAIEVGLIVALGRSGATGAAIAMSVTSVTAAAAFWLLVRRHLRAPEPVAA